MKPSLFIALCLLSTMVPWFVKEVVKYASSGNAGSRANAAVG